MIEHWDLGEYLNIPNHISISVYCHGYTITVILNIKL
jgi:hypothetical protein